MNKAYKLSLWILQQDPDNESGLAPRAVSAAEGNPRRILLDTASLEIVPIGWSADGSYVFIDRVFPEGDSLYRVGVNTGTVELITRLSSIAANGAILSPDGEAILINLPSAFPRVWTLALISTKDGRTQPIASGSIQPYQYAWSDNGQSLFVVNSSSKTKYNLLKSSKDGVLSLMADTASTDMAQFGAVDTRLMVPESTSSDGRWLLLRKSGSDSETLFLQDKAGGGLLAVPSEGWTQFLGWLNNMN